jgi:hypothetical protein
LEPRTPRGSRPKDGEALEEERVWQLERKVGRLVLENDVMKEAMRLRSFDRKTSEG